MTLTPKEAGWRPDPSFRYGLKDRVRKVRGSQWQGRVVGFYITDFTPEGYCVESEREIGSVQVWPLAALEAVPEDKPKITTLEEFDAAINKGNCRCEEPIIRCDNHGCRCEVCGRPERTDAAAMLSPDQLALLTRSTK